MVATVIIGAWAYTCYAAIVHTGLRPLENLDDLATALERARQAPILLFKHSHTCGLSAQAYAELADLLATGDLPVDVYLVSVRASPDVSSAVAARFGVRHESPQVLLVHGDAVLWHGSHFRVTASQIRAALERVAAIATG